MGSGKDLLDFRQRPVVFAFRQFLIHLRKRYLLILRLGLLIFQSGYLRLQIGYGILRGFSQCFRFHTDLVARLETARDFRTQLSHFNMRVNQMRDKQKSRYPQCPG